MELDELKILWKNHYNQAEPQVTLNKNLLKSVSLSNIQSNLSEFRATAIIELIFNGLFIIYLKGFIYNHWYVGEFVVPAAILLLLVGIHLIWNIYSLVQASSLNYGLSITDTQKKINTLIIYTRYQKISLYVIIPLFALCFAIVLPKALFGFSIYPYLGIQWYYQLLGTIAITPIIVWFVGLFPDKGLIKAQQFLEDIVKFEKTEYQEL